MTEYPGYHFILIEKGEDNKTNTRQHKRMHWDFDYLFVLDWKLPGETLPYLGEVNEWCEQQFGRSGEKERWEQHSIYIGFRDAHDAFAFKMRWG